MGDEIGIEEQILEKRASYKEYVDIPCPLGCGKMIRGISKKHWLRNFETHLSGKRHNIKNTDEQKRLVEKFGKPAIKYL